MNNDNSLSILKTFTRKLANCRYKVSLDNVIKYMREGRFGYSIDEKSDTVITNDYVFADDVSALLSHIRAIFKEPHIFLKREEIVQNASVAKKLDIEAIKMNYRDEKLWRLRETDDLFGDEEEALEFVHAFVHEDNLAIYENRFICTLIDLIYDAVSKKLNQLYAEFDTVNLQILGHNYDKGLASKTYVDYEDTYDGLPVLLSLDQPIVNVINSLLNTKKHLLALKSRELYKACKKAGAFNLSALKATNIFLHDKDYNYCYLFYTNYLNRDPVITTERKMYQGFFEINLFTAFDKLGFKPSEETQDILVSNNANIKFDKLLFIKEPFTAEVSIKSETELLIKFTSTPDGSISNVIFRTISSSETASIEGFTNINDYADNISNNLPFDIMRSYVITDIQDAVSENCICVVPEKSDSLAKIIETIKSCLLIVEGVYAVYSKYCPICGTNLLAPEGDDFVCTSCEAQYHIFNYASKDIIWVKRLPKADELNRGIYDTEKVEEEITTSVDEVKQIETAVTEILTETTTVVTEETVTETTETEIPEQYTTRTNLKRSFVSKLSQSSDENKAYYNEIKNYILAYKKVSSRTSWACDTFSSSREPKIRLAVRGKTLVAFFALDPEKYDDKKFFGHDYGDIKRYEDTPLLVKIKSDRGVKRVKELVDIVLDGLDKKKVFVPEVYKFPYKSDKTFLKEGLIKKIVTKVKIK